MDIRHFYREKGEGETLVLLHGNGEDSSYFSSQIEAFSQFYHVFALDTRGHGKTPRGDAPFTIRQFARDLLDFFDAHGIEKAHLLGFSDGANIAMSFALANPRRLSSLVLNDIAVIPALRYISTSLSASARSLFVNITTGSIFLLTATALILSIMSVLGEGSLTDETIKSLSRFASGGRTR